MSSNYLIDQEHSNAGDPPLEYVLFDPNFIDSSGTYLEPFVEVLSSTNERLGVARFMNQRVFYPKKYRGRLVFQVRLEHESFYGKGWKDSKTSSKLSNELNAWWSTLGILGSLKIVGHETCRGVRFINVELIR
jgi:hypothetical protein